MATNSSASRTNADKDEKLRRLKELEGTPEAQTAYAVELLAVRSGRAANQAALRVLARQPSLEARPALTRLFEQMAANKVRGIRAALVWSEATATLAREHNDANVISIGARQHTVEEATRFIDLFIATPFSGEERHARRIAQLAAYEEEGALEPDPRATTGQPDVLAADDSSFDPEAG